MILLVNSLTCFAGENNGNEEYSYGHFKYRIDENGDVYITQYGFDMITCKTIDSIIIPNEINGKKVIGADHNIITDLYYPESIKSIRCSDYMRTVDMQSFNGAMELESIKLGKYTKKYKCVGYDEGDPESRRVYKYLGYYRIKLPADAKYFKLIRGSLYSKDGTTLYKAYGRTNKRGYKVPKNTKRIHKYAFLATPYTTLKLNNKIATIDKGTFSHGNIQVIKIPKKSKRRILKIIKKAKMLKWQSKYMTFVYF